MNQALIMSIIRSRLWVVIVVAVLLLLNAGLYVYFAFYQTPRVAELREKVSSLRGGAGGAPQDAAAVYKQGKADLLLWDQKILQKKDFVRFLGDLFNMAKGDALNLGGITYKPALLKEEPLVAYAISFNVTGKYPDIKRFIGDLSHLNSIVVIDSLSLNNSNMVAEYVDLKVQLTAYFRMGAQ